MRRISSQTTSDWRVPRAAVGSSIRIPVVLHIEARATATACFWPPERAATWTRTEGSLICSAASAVSDSRAIELRLIIPILPISPGRATSRPRNMFSSTVRSGASARS